MAVPGAAASKRLDGRDDSAIPLLNAAGFSPRHGFTTRAGGLSEGPYASLNLGLSSGDEPVTVEANRDLLLAQLGLERSQVCGYHQVHGDVVELAAPGWFERQADASISNDPNLLLVVSAADCFPVLFHDPRTGAVGAAHCGWRGTVLQLASKVVGEMGRRFGSAAADLEVAIGQGVMGSCYQVSRDVAERFVAAGFPDTVFPGAALPGTVIPGAAASAAASPAANPADPKSRADDDRPLLDILAAIRFDLQQAGVGADRIHALERCTHCEPTIFYSHRRDAGVTGRMWGFVQAGGVAG